METNGAKQRAEGRISVRDVEKVYDPEGVNVRALENCNMEIQPGEFVMMVGPSGCGKTTLLNAIAGFSNVTKGKIKLDDSVIAAPGMTQAPGADRIVVFQGGALFPWKTVLKNLIYGPMVQGKDKNEAIADARMLMDKLCLNRKTEDMYPDNLSSGMKRQVEIIRALINNPKVLLLDEPFRALDSLSKSLMHEYLLEVFEITKKTIFFITHDLEEAVFLADRVLIMTTRPGTIKAEIKIDIPRPRNYKVLGTERFAELKERAVEAVREETLKAFEAGERELA